MGIADLIALKPTLLKRKTNSQLDQHLSFFFKIVHGEKSCTVSLNESENMNCWLWPD